MKILSFDVGIKNLAYCYLEYDNNTINIIEWDIIDLCERNIGYVKIKRNVIKKYVINRQNSIKIIVIIVRHMQKVLNF